MLSQRLDTLREKLKPWDECRRCPLGTLASKHVQIDTGDWDESTVIGLDRLPILLVGEAPGESEDVVGLPFVGRSGKLLRQAIEDALSGLNLYVPWMLTNCIACRPCDGPNTKNREPLESELLSCRPRLETVLMCMVPRVTVCLGRTAAQSVPLAPLLPLRDSLIGREWSRVELVHPAAICRRGGTETPQYLDFVRKLQGAFTIAENYIHETLT